MAHGSPRPPRRTDSPGGPGTSHGLQQYAGSVSATSPSKILAAPKGMHASGLVPSDAPDVSAVRKHPKSIHGLVGYGIPRQGHIALRLCQPCPHPCEKRLPEPVHAIRAKEWTACPTLAPSPVSILNQYGLFQVVVYNPQNCVKLFDEIKTQLRKILECNQPLAKKGSLDVLLRAKQAAA